jgi:DNA-binding beta-propeller fold protein YncE
MANKAIVGTAILLAGIGVLVAISLFSEIQGGQNLEVEHVMNIDVAPRRGGIIAIHPDGTEIYKIDPNQVTGYHLSVWDALTGELIREIVAEKRIVRLRDIDLSPDGTEIYATELRRGYIHVFSSKDGRRLRGWKVEGAPDPAKIRAHSLAVSPDGKEIYVDVSRADEVQVFNPSGTLLRRFPAPRPHEIDVGQEGRELFVANLGNQVDVYDINGVHLRKFGQDCNPLGVAVGTDGTVYVTGGDSVCIFDSEGILLQKFGAPGIGNGQFNKALTSAVHERTLFVSDGRSPNAEDPGNMRIQKFQLRIRPKLPARNSHEVVPQ